MSSVYNVPAERVFGKQASKSAEVVCSLWGKFDGTATLLSVIVAVIGDREREGKLKLVCVDKDGNLFDGDDGYYVIKTFLQGTRPVSYDPYDPNTPDADQTHKWTGAGAMTETWGSTSQAETVLERIEASILLAVRNVQDQTFIDAIRDCLDHENQFRPVMLEFSMRGELIVDKRLRGAFSILQSLKAQKESASYPSTGPTFVFWRAFDHWQNEDIDVEYRKYCLKSTFEEFSITGAHRTSYALKNFEQGRKILEHLPVFSFLDKQHRMQYGPAILYKTESCSGESTSHPLIHSLNRETLNLKRIVKKQHWDLYKRNLWNLTAVCRQELNLEGFVLYVQRGQEDPLFFKCKQYTLVSLPQSWALQPRTFIKQKFDQISAAKQLHEHSSYLNELWDCVDYSHSKESLQRANYNEKTTEYKDRAGHLSAMITIGDEGRSVRMGDWVETDIENRPLSSSLALLSMLPRGGASIWAIEYPLTGTVHVCGQAYFLTTTSQASIMKNDMLNATGENHNTRPRWIDYSEEGEFNPTKSIPALNATRMLHYATHQKQYCDYRKNRREIKTTLRYATAMHCFFVFLMSSTYERIVDKIIKYWPTMSALMRRMLVEILMTSNRGQTVRAQGTTHEDYHPFRSVLTNKIFECAQSHRSTASKVADVMVWLKGNAEKEALNQTEALAQAEALQQCFAYFDERCLEIQLSRTFSLINDDSRFQNTQDVLNHLLHGFETVLPNNWQCFDTRHLSRDHFFHDACQNLIVGQAKLNAQTLPSTINTFCSFWNYNNAALGPFPAAQEAEFLQSYVYDLRKQINDSLFILRTAGLAKTMNFGTQRLRQNHGRFGNIPADVQIKDYRPRIVYKLKILTNLYSRKKQRPYAVFYGQL